MTTKAVQNVINFLDDSTRDQELNRFMSDGNFIVEIRISQSLEMISDLTTSQLLNEQIDKHLERLPDGTEVKEIQSSYPMSDTFKVHKITFYNELFRKMMKSEVIDMSNDKYKVLIYVNKDGELALLTELFKVDLVKRYDGYVSYNAGFGKKALSKDYKFIGYL